MIPSFREGMCENARSVSYR